MCPPRTSSSSPETSWAPVEIRHFPCGQPATTGAPRAQRAPRGCCRARTARSARRQLVISHSFALNSPAKIGRAPARLRPAPPTKSRLSLRASSGYAGGSRTILSSRAPWGAAQPLCTTTLQCPRAPRGFRSAAFMPLQRVRCGDARTRDDVRTVKRRERRAPWAAAPPHRVHRVSAIPPNRLNRIATANP